MKVLKVVRCAIYYTVFCYFAVFRGRRDVYRYPSCSSVVYRSRSYDSGRLSWLGRFLCGLALCERVRDANQLVYGWSEQVRGRNSYGAYPLVRSTERFG